MSGKHEKKPDRLSLPALLAERLTAAARRIGKTAASVLRSAVTVLQSTGAKLRAAGTEFRARLAALRSEKTAKASEKVRDASAFRDRLKTLKAGKHAGIRSGRASSLFRSDRIVTAAILLVLAAGVALLLYPGLSDRANRKRSGRTIEAYSGTVTEMSAERQSELLEAARDYNKELKPRTRPALPEEKDRERYDALLNIDGSGIMGYVEIPSLEAEIPIFHGTEEKVLQTAVGHLDWTSLPVGGEGSHCALFGHRGLPSAKLFTDLDQLREGDVFRLKVLGETLSYEVDQILVVLPEETEELNIVPGMDYCTLVTCTPYGVNSHRLMVRGRRIEEIRETEAVRITSDATQVEPMMTALVIALVLTAVMGIGVTAIESRQKRRPGADGGKAYEEAE